MSPTRRFAARALLLASLGLGACGSEEPTSSTTDARTALDAVVPPLRPGDLRPGDVLVSIDGQPVSSKADAMRVVEGIPPGRVVEVVIDRKGERVTLEAGPGR